MAVQIVAPKLGMSMSDVTVVEWKVEEGEKVEKGTVVLVIETEKTEWSVEAEASGFLHVLVQEGTKAKIGQVVGLIAETNEELEKLRGETPQAFAADGKKVPSAEAVGGKPEVAGIAKGEGERIRISPVARKMAEEQMVDIAHVKGTGPDGRIVKEDIEKVLEELKKAPVPQEKVARVLPQRNEEGHRRQDDQ
jgi:pyruvate dehydrogenase E2 component (dihydrolipoamide acetyltransferase)